LLPPEWAGESEGKKKHKLVSQDKGSLTEQQRKRIVTTIMLIRTGEYPEQLSPPGQLSPSVPSMTAHGIRYPIFWASLGQPTWLCPLWASGDNTS